MMNNTAKELDYDFDEEYEYENEPQYEYKPNNAYERSISKPVDTRIWLVKGEWIDRFTPIARQLFVVGLFFVGLFGTWLALSSFLAAFTAQLLLTGFQWANRKRKKTVWYLAPLVIDSMLTLTGYRQYVFDTVFKSWLAVINGVQNVWLSLSNSVEWSAETMNTTATTLSWAFILFAAVYVAYAPEGLVDE